MSDFRAAYIVLGPSGSGKDTQAELLSNELGDIPVLSTGELLRKVHEKGTPLGEKAWEYMQKGVWVPDDLLFSVLREELPEEILQKGVIFTGFPRTRNQAEKLTRFLSERSLELKTVFHLDTSHETSLKRVGTRLQEQEETGVVRSDDMGETIKKRLESYDETIGDVLDFYQEKGFLVRINNELPIKEVFQQIRKTLND